MQIFEIGGNRYSYNTKKEFYYKVTKDFYLKDSKLFKIVLSKDSNDNKNSTFIEIIKDHKFYFDITSEKKEQWNEIVNELVEKYGGGLVENFDSVNSEEEKEQTDEELVELIKNDMEKNVKPNTKLHRMLQWSPIDDNGNSEWFYFNDVYKREDYDAETDNKIIPHNGNSWYRTILKYLKYETVTEGSRISGYRFVGYNVENRRKKVDRRINPTIRKILQNSGCSHCGIPNRDHEPHEIDHKNGRYNDEFIFDYKKQKIDDFQVLCQKDNKYKRTCCLKCVETEKRFDAQFLGYPISVTQGTLQYENDLGCVGCYWFDPISFKSKLMLSK